MPGFQEVMIVWGMLLATALILGLLCQEMRRKDDD